jgi:hypothetical protein
MEKSAIIFQEKLNLCANNIQLKELSEEIVLFIFKRGIFLQKSLKEFKEIKINNEKNPLVIKKMMRKTYLEKKFSELSLAEKKKAFNNITNTFTNTYRRVTDKIKGITPLIKILLDMECHLDLYYDTQTDKRKYLKNLISKLIDMEEKIDKIFEEECVVL